MSNTHKRRRAIMDDEENFNVHSNVRADGDLQSSSLMIPGRQKQRTKNLPSSSSSVTSNTLSFTNSPNDSSSRISEFRAKKTSAPVESSDDDLTSSMLFLCLFSLYLFVPAGLKK
jgi:hypothetical protein